VNEQSPFWKPKFLSASFVQVISSIALFTGHIDQGSYIALATMTLATFTAASVVENKIVPPVPAMTDKA